MRYYSCTDSLHLAERVNSECRKCAVPKYTKRKGECSILLNESLNSYYWIGFILADAHIHDNKRLVIKLSKKDEHHLHKLRKYLGVKKLDNNKNQSCLSIMETRTFQRLSEKFDIKSNKTEIPPKISVFKKLPRKKLLSLFCGFIDGDGCIRNQSNGRPDFNLAIKCHSSWLEILKMFSERFLQDCTVKLNSSGYAALICSNTKVMKKLKEEVLVLNLPLLERKWRKIDLNYKGRVELAEERLIIARKLRKNKKSFKFISKKLKMSISGVCLLLQRNKSI